MTDETHEAPAVILATGSAYKELGLPEEKKLSGHGVSWCATCDGFFFRDQDIIVVGGGDSAMEEATFLTRFAKSVTVVVRRARLRASRIMAQRAKDNPKISFAWNSAITTDPRRRQGHRRHLGQTPVTGATREQAATGIFVAIGHLPRTELVAGQVDLDDEGYIKVDAPTTVHQPLRRLRLRRRGGPPLPPGDHRRRDRLRGGPGRRTLPRRTRGRGQHRHRPGRRTHPRLTNQHAWAADTPGQRPGGR